MTIPYHQQRSLRRIRRSVTRSDPHLAAMLIIFTRLYAGEKMPRWERVSHRVPRAIRALTRFASAAAHLIARVAVSRARLAGRTARHAVGVIARLRLVTGRRQRCGTDHS
jgi:hypothetical protein